MGKIRRFLGFLVLACTVAFGATSAAFAEEITLHWVPAYGDAPADTTCTYGETFDVPAGPTVTGRNFVSWTTNGHAYQPGETVDCIAEELGVFGGTATFTGSFTPIHYSITYELNGGTNSGLNKTDYTIDSGGVTLYNPTRPNSSFKGWYNNANFSGSKVTKITAGTTGNRILYAKWACQSNYNDNDNDNICTLNQFSIPYDCGTDATGTPPTTTIATYSETFTTSQNTCNRDGYQFGGWRVSGTDDIKPAGNSFTWKYTTAKTLTAEWVQTPGNCTIGQYYDSANNTCQSCPTGYTSDLGGTDITDCYTACQANCVNPGRNNCYTDITNIQACTYNSEMLVPGIQHYGSSDCSTNNTCDFATVTCKGDFYATGDYSYYNNNHEINTNVCASCSKATGGAYPNSAILYNTGINSCFSESTYDCRRDLDTLTPARATCSLPGDGTVNGVIYYPNPKTSDYVAIRPGIRCTVINCVCEPGYTFNTNTNTCDLNVYTITLDDNGGSGGDGVIYEKYTYGFVATTYDDTKIENISNIPTKTNWVFWGYWDAPTGGTQYIDIDGNLPVSSYVFTEDKTLYAHWVRGIYNCESGKAADKTTTCEEGYYCPGGNVPLGDEESAEIGCQRLCPEHPDGDQVSSAAGSDDITDCFSTTTGVNLTDGTGGGDLVCAYHWDDATNTGDFTTTCNPVDIKYCTGGFYYDPITSTTSCTEVGNGYWSPEPTSNVADAVSMARYSCNVLPEHNNATTVGQTSALPTSCYNTCTNKDITDTNNVKIGESAANPTKSFFTGTILTYDAGNQTVTTSGAYPACTYDAPVCITGYHTSGTTCAANTYTVTYDCGTGGGTAPTTNVSATYNSSFTPAGVGSCTKVGHSFAGWKISNTETIVNSAFNWTYTTNKTLTAQWTPNVYTVTLNDGSDATTHGAPSTLYVKYGVGWYTDAGATNVITNLTQLPTKTSYEFESYSLGGVEIINENGVFLSSTFTSTPATLSVVWAAAKINCAPGEYYAGQSTTCTPCEQNYFCPGGEFTMFSNTISGRKACPAGSTSDAHASSITSCYCAMAPNAKEMNALDYSDTNAVASCTIKLCLPGYHLNAGECKPCPVGSYCDGTLGTNGDGSTSCTTLGSGDAFTTWSNSSGGATAVDATHCYAICVDRAVTNGHAYPIEGKETVNYDNNCEFYGISTPKDGATRGNPCDVNQLALGVCVESACHSEFEMINGECLPCARDANALTYAPTGNCIVATCQNGYHPDGYNCASDVVSCTASIPNAYTAYSEWNPTAKSYGKCTLTECNNGYHPESNACVLDKQTCSVPNGIGTQTWDDTLNKWGPCIVTSCDAGYTEAGYIENDSEKPTQCIDCPNKHSAGGDIAVSSYIKGCEIAACMYQGEKYALEDGECVRICPDTPTPDPDRTGTKYWDPTHNKCVRTCLLPGYIKY